MPIPINTLGSILVASIQVDLTVNTLLEFQDQLLEKTVLQATSGVLLDLSGVKSLDKSNFDQLHSIINSVGIIGPPCVLVGLRPGLVCALIELGTETSDLHTVTSLEQGIELINQHKSHSRSKGT